MTYHNAENGFCVLGVKARGHKDPITVVGHAAVISAGKWVQLSRMIEQGWAVVQEVFRAARSGL